jgi:sugar lactone lactonase YvrE
VEPRLQAAAGHRSPCPHAPTRHVPQSSGAPNGRTPNKPGHELDSFLEGPSFDREGNLYVTDIPFGRIFRITPALEWTLVAEYDGWPNGIATHKDGSLWIADYRRGLLSLSRRLPEADDGTPSPILAHRNSESFKGLNDLTFDRDGHCYFTDQGQTGCTIRAGGSTGCARTDASIA